MLIDNNARTEAPSDRRRDTVQDDADVSIVLRADLSPLARPSLYPSDDEPARVA